MSDKEQIAPFPNQAKFRQKRLKQHSKWLRDNIKLYDNLRWKSIEPECKWVERLYHERWSS